MVVERFKVWLFYLLEDRGLYAYTSEKEYAKEFRRQRNMKCFFEKTISLTEEEYKIFNYAHNRKMLFRNPLSDGKYDYYFQTTNEENFEIDRLTIEIEDKMRWYENFFLHAPFQPQLHEAFEVLAYLVRKEESGGLKGHYNTLGIFFYLFAPLMRAQKK